MKEKGLNTFQIKVIRKIMEVLFLRVLSGAFGAAYSVGACVICRIREK